MNDLAFDTADMLDAVTPPVVRTRRVGSVRGRLVVLVLATILPLVTMLAGLVVVDYRADRAREGEHQLDIARSMAATVERELGGATASLEALALSPRLQQSDMPGFRALALRFVATQPAGSSLTLLDASGQHLVDTVLPADAALPRREAGANRVLTDRVFAIGRPVVSNLFRPALGPSLVVTAEVPVWRDGKVVYDLSLVLPESRLNGILSDQRLPPGSVSSIFDRNGIHVARFPDNGTFLGRPATAALRPSLQSRAEGVIDSVALDGTPLLTAFSHGQPSGWSVTMGVPEATLRAPLLRSLSVTLAGALVTLLASIGVATMMARQTLRPIRALTSFAADPTQDTARFGLREIDDVAAVLRHGQRERLSATLALRALNQELEARIRQETANRVQAQAQLAQSQRMEALGQLAGGIAHDFNNVLQAVHGGLSLIARHPEDAASVARLAGMAINASDRGAAITGRLLTFARRGELAGVAIEPRALLDGLQEMLAHTLGSLIHVRVVASDGLPRLLADKAQLETVLVNLAVNARDAMPDGGEVVLTAGEDSVAEPSAHAAQLQPGRYLRIAVSDDGVGMTPEVLARASEPFFTTKEPGQGTGLGLAMARGFAQQSGGAMQIASLAGAGTRITLWFPQADARPPPPAARPDDLPPMRVLMVDDDDMVREAVAGELEAQGFVVSTAADGAAALALLETAQPIDLLITDYAMPGMTGVALLSEARRHRPGLPALVLTGYAEDAAETALSGAQDRLTVLLLKPITGSELARRASALRRRPRRAEPDR